MEVEEVVDSDRADNGAELEKNIILSVRDAAQEYWDWEIEDGPTSKEILDLCPPTRTAAEVLEELLEHWRSFAWWT